MTIRILLFSLLFTTLTMACSAQRSDSKRERMEALKVAFITEELALTAQQAKVFWPLYNQLEEELRTLRRQGKKRPDFATASDDEIKAWINKKLETEAQQAVVKRSYLERFEQVISWQQIAQLMHVEQRFKKELLQRIQDRRSERTGR